MIIPLFCLFLQSNSFVQELCVAWWERGDNDVQCDQSATDLQWQWRQPAQAISNYKSRAGVSLSEPRWVNKQPKFNAIRRLSDVSHLRFQCSIIIVVIIVMATVTYWILISQIPYSSDSYTSLLIILSQTLKNT